MAQRTLVAIPVYNEERTVLTVIDRVAAHVRDILVINDGSTDRTSELLRLRPGLRIINHPENRGYGQSLADAFAFARRRRFDWLITIDADDQHEADLIPEFLRIAQEEDVDIISGTRYPDGYDVEQAARIAPEDRRRINRNITALLNRDLSLGLTDAFCGFKAYRAEALEHLRITIPGYAMPMQLWVQAARAGLRIREIPVELRYPDPTRHFGGILDDPASRLAHYLDVYRAELGRSSCWPCSDQAAQQI